MDSWKEQISHVLMSLPSMIAAFSAAGPAGWIAGGVLFAAVALILYLIYRWMQKVANERAHAESEKRRAEDQKKIEDENNETSENSQTAEENIRDKVKKRLEEMKKEGIL